MKPFQNDKDAADALSARYKTLRQEISKAIVGQDDVIEKLVIAILCRSHALLVGVPGLAKTLLISSVAKALHLKFSRIQFTPDLMPSDILGTEVLEVDEKNGKKHFRFIKGPVFANIVLADEINRTPPKTQAALLEAMQEKKITVAGQTHELYAPFFVLATQNPIEQEGTYPLPEAQQDRFMFNIRVDYPSLEEELEIIRRTTGTATGEPSPVMDSDEISAFQNLIRKVPVTENVIRYAVELVARTRLTGKENDSPLKDLLSWGAGPRASQFLVLGAKAHAILKGKYAPDIEDVRAVALPVLRHRIVPSFTAEAEGITSDDLIRRIL